MNAQVAEIVEGIFGVKAPSHLIAQLAKFDLEEVRDHVQLLLSDQGLEKVKDWYDQNSYEDVDTFNWEAVRMEIEDQWMNSGEYAYAEVYKGPGRRNPEVIEFAGDEIEFKVF